MRDTTINRSSTRHCGHSDMTVVDEWDEVDVEGDGRAEALVFKVVQVRECTACGHHQRVSEPKR